MVSHPLLPSSHKNPRTILTMNIATWKTLVAIVAYNPPVTAYEKIIYDEDLANHIDPESCACSHKAAGEALTGEGAGRY